MNERETYIKARLAAAGVDAVTVEHMIGSTYKVFSSTTPDSGKLKLHGFRILPPAEAGHFFVADLHSIVKSGLDADPGPAADFHPPSDLVNGVATALAEPAVADEDTRELKVPLQWDAPPIPPVEPEYRIPEDYEELRELVAVQHAQLEEAGHQVLEAVQVAVNAELRNASLLKVNQAQSEMLRESLASLGVKPRVEIKTLVQDVSVKFNVFTSDEELAAALNDGWEIINIGFTTHYIGDSSEDQFVHRRVITLSRPVAPPRPQPSAHTEAHATAEVPATDPVDAPAPQPVIVAHQPVGVSLNGLPMAQEIRLHGLDVWKSGMNAELFTDAQSEYIRKLDDLQRLGGMQPLRALPSSN